MVTPTPVPNLPTAARPFLEVPPVPLRVSSPPPVDVVEGGVLFPPPVRPGTVIVENPGTPETVQPVFETPVPPQTVQPVPDRLFVQPTPPNAPAVPNYPRKQARH